MSVRRGDRVKPGDAIAMLETGDATIAVAQAEAALAQAEAQLANLQVGRRPEEIAVLEATLVSAQAQKEEAERVLSRLADLLKRGISTQADFDQAKTALDVADGDGRPGARPISPSPNCRRGRRRSRPPRTRSSRRRPRSSRREWRLSKRTIAAPAAGRIDDIIRNPGDLAGPSAPVLSMLPDGAVKLTALSARAELRLGRRSAACSTCIATAASPA